MRARFATYSMFRSGAGFMEGSNIPSKQAVEGGLGNRQKHAGVLFAQFRSVVGLNLAPMPLLSTERHGHKGQPYNRRATCSGVLNSFKICLFRLFREFRGHFRWHGFWLGLET